MTVKDVHKICPVCNSEKILKRKKYYSGKGLLKCKSCGLYFMERIPSPEELLEHYSDYPYVFPMEVRISVEKNYEDILLLLEPCRKNNLLLEYGCGTGLFLKKAIEKGWGVAGVELSEKAIIECRKEGIPVCYSLEEVKCQTNKPFDVVVSIEVIEHLSDFNGSMKQINNLLRKGGGFYCTTPNFNNPARYLQKENYHIIEYPEHLLYFNTRSLNTGMKIAGFRPGMIKTTGLDISARRKRGSGNKDNQYNLTSNEKYLARSNKSYILGFFKDLINLFLSFFRIGMTSKALFLKND